jgi:hypothetical protein
MLTNLQQAFALVPANIASRTADLRIYLPTQLVNIYRLGVASGNTNAYITQDLNLTYLGIKIVLCPGMSNDHLVITLKDNLVYLFDGEGDPSDLRAVNLADTVAEPYIRRRAIRHLEKHRIVIFGAGTGNPYFTTDTAGSLRAIEIGADVILKGTRVNGIYSADPEKDPTATKYDTISFKECIDKNLKIMDMTAFTLCMENNLPIIVFDMNQEGNLKRLILGEQIGTLVK